MIQLSRPELFLYSYMGGSEEIVEELGQVQVSHFPLFMEEGEGFPGMKKKDFDKKFSA